MRRTPTTRAPRPRWSRSRPGRTSKADQNPAEWLPPASDQYCRYIGEWIGTKLRWGLTVNKLELEALKTFAGGPCEETVIDHQPMQ